MRGFTNLWLPYEVLEAFPPDREGLKRYVAGEISDEALWEIASSDSWSDATHNFVYLKHFQKGADGLPEGIEYGEPLTLFQYRSDEELERTLGVRQLHLARAFCYCEVMRDPQRHEDIFEGWFGDALPTLLAAATVLDTPYRTHLARLLTWSLRHIGSNHSHYLEQAFALFAVASYEAAPHGAKAHLVAEWLDRLSDEYALENFVAGLQPDDFRHRFKKFDAPWQQAAIRDLRDRLPPESELRYAIEPFVRP